jgi:hypothetical protein
VKYAGYLLTGRNSCRIIHATRYAQTHALERIDHFPV